MDLRTRARRGSRLTFWLHSAALQLVLAGLALAVATPARAQSTDGSLPPDDSLYRRVAALDSTLFDAYNRCDLATFASLLDDDIEFFHDRDGFSRGKAPVVDAIRVNICGKVSRQLVPGSLEVYPIPGYGAIEMGVHRFHHPGHDDTEPVGEARFVHIWARESSGWKLTRVISVGHHALPD